MEVASLRKKTEFQILFKKGKRLYKEHFTVVYLFQDAHDNDPPSLKIAYVVSKKVSVKAVIRNKIKRRMRVAVREPLKERGLQDMELEKNIFIAIIASKKVLEASFQQISLEIKESLEKLV